MVRATFHSLEGTSIYGTTWYAVHAFANTLCLCEGDIPKPNDSFVLFPSIQGIRKAREVHAQLVDLMKQQHLIPQSSDGSWDHIRKAICSAYFYNSSKMKGIGDYINMLSGIPSALHPSSALFGLGYTPDYVCYHELISTSKEYMSCVTAVEGEWLAELGPMFFSIKESYEKTLKRRQQERVHIAEIAKRGRITDSKE